MANIKKIIREELEKVSNGGYRQIGPFSSYVSSLGATPRMASKFQRINARPAKPGEVVHTVLADGTNETSNVAQEGDYVVNNVGSPEQWIVRGKDFVKKYVEDEGNPGVYRPKGGPMEVFDVGEDIEGVAPWGENMRVKKGGYIMRDPNNPNDAYGIGLDEFNKSYKFH